MLVFVLDMDGTIVGDANNLLCKASVQGKFCPDDAYFKHSGIIRPHFESFLKTIQYAGAQVYVYTAAEKKWATNVIKAVEKALDVKFNRPLFTRAECLRVDGVFRKSLDKITPRLVKKHSGLKQNNIVLIDNNDVIVPTSDHRCIRCPTYSYLPCLDVLRHEANIYETYQKHAAILYNFGFLTKPNFSCVQTFFANYYGLLARQMYESVKNKQMAMADTFWLQMETYFRSNNVKEFDKKTMSHIRRYISN